MVRQQHALHAVTTALSNTYNVPFLQTEHMHICTSTLWWCQEHASIRSVQDACVPAGTGDGDKLHKWRGRGKSQGEGEEAGGGQRVGTCNRLDKTMYPMI